ncbi:MAG TPA: helix-turn-helix transcriptional regulator [Pararhizobium sp.]|nr:helix-turn-helix transcriptional regulator [Pararhizobium sp.]
MAAARHNDPELATEAVTPWRFSAGHAFEVSGGRGRLERLAFDSGLILYRSEIEIFDTCIVEVQNTSSGPWLRTCTHIVGDSTLEAPDGQRFVVSPERSLLLRVDRSGTRFHLDGGQVLRHVGVSMTVSALERRLGAFLPDGLEPFAGDVGSATVIREMRTSARLLALATSLFSPRTEGPFRLLMLEGIATQILSEVIDAVCRPADDGGGGIAQWERLALADVIERVQSNPGAPFLVPDLAAGVGLSPNRLDRIFRNELRRSPVEFIRGERLREAQRLLELGELSIGEIAARVGYAHTSNFTRAYRCRFGETPARTLRRSRDETLSPSTC